MIRLEAVLAELRDVGPHELADWIARGWLVPEGEPPDWLFAETDLQRARRVRDLRLTAGVAEDTLAMVLSLLDQIDDLRLALRTVTQAAAQLPPELRRALLARLRA